MLILIDVCSPEFLLESGLFSVVKLIIIAKKTEYYWKDYITVLPTVRNMTNAVNMELYDFLNDIPETRTRCGFRENMIRQANKPAM